MTLQARHLGSRLLVILALVAGIVAVQWTISYSSLSQAPFTSVGGDSGGGGHIRTVSEPGGDVGGGHIRSVDSVGGDNGGGH